LLLSVTLATQVVPCPIRVLGRSPDRHSFPTRALPISLWGIIFSGCLCLGVQGNAGPDTKRNRLFSSNKKCTIDECYILWRSFFVFFFKKRKIFCPCEPKNLQ